MNLSVVGAGYVGLVSAACFSEFGATVTCIDRDRDRIELLNGGGVPIFEPGLEQLVNANMRAGPAHLQHLPCRGGCGRRRRLHRGRNPDPAR